MPDKHIRVLNFDASIIRQKNLCRQYSPEIIDFQDIAAQARYWANQKTAHLIEQRLKGSTKSKITFIGSGDFHQISSLLIKEFSQPLCVIIFDLHPDWDCLPPRLGCGSWVTETLRNKQVLKVISLGVASLDISTNSLETANTSSLKNDRLEIYPYAHQPSLVFTKRVPKNSSLKSERKLFYTKIFWDELKNKNLAEFTLQLIGRLPVKEVYISIDKDCLNNRSALTNWEEGKMKLDELCLMLKIMRENLNIVGLDITGDYSKIKVCGAVKKFISGWDHPKAVAAEKLSPEAVTKLNEETNLKLLSCLT